MNQLTHLKQRIVVVLVTWLGTAKRKNGVETRRTCARIGPSVAARLAVLLLVPAHYTLAESASETVERFEHAAQATYADAVPFPQEKQDIEGYYKVIKASKGETKAGLESDLNKALENVRKGEQGSGAELENVKDRIKAYKGEVEGVLKAREDARVKFKEVEDKLNEVIRNPDSAFESKSSSRERDAVKIACQKILEHIRDEKKEHGRVIGELNSQIINIDKLLAKQP